MIEIELKTEPQDYKRTIIAFLTIPFDPQQGATFDEVMAVGPVLEKASSAEGELELTEAEYEMIVARFRNGRYEQNSLDVYQMLKDICGV
jgi:hypothetical protein